MNYHWEQLNPDTVVLFPSGTSWRGEVNLPNSSTAIHTARPYLVPNAKIMYKAAGFFVNPAQDFGSLEEAQRAVGDIARAAGHTVDGQ